MLDNGILFNRNEKVHFDFAETTSKVPHDVRRHSYSIGAHEVIISLKVHIFLPNLAYRLRKGWVILTKNIVCVMRLCSEL